MDEGVQDIVDLFDYSEKFLKNDDEEKRASCIEVDEEGELDEGVQDIVDLKGENAAKKQNLELEYSQAEKLCLNSRESFGQTKDRNGKGSSSEEPKKRRSSNDMIGFLRAQEK